MPPERIIEDVKYTLVEYIYIYILVYVSFLLFRVVFIADSCDDNLPPFLSGSAFITVLATYFDKVFFKSMNIFIT